MEAETLSIISWGFHKVDALSLVVIIKLWISKKDKSFIWFIAQLIFLYFGFLKFLYSIKMKPEVAHTMLSEENTLAIGISGTLWAISMLCMLIGIWNLSKKSKY